MPNPFKSLEDLLEQLLKNHIDDGLLKQVIENQALAQSTLGALKTTVETIQADIVSIKVFLGITDATGATQEEVDALGKRVQDETAAIQQFDQGIPPQG